MLYEKIELEPNEDILQVVRKHWFLIFVEQFGFLMMALIPFFILALVTFLPEMVSIDLHPERYLALITFGISAWLLLVLMMSFTAWTHYYLDLWVITDRRIILVDQIHFFNRNVSIFRLERLQDIEYVISGIIPTLLNFGTIQAQTAGAHESNFTTKGLPDPKGLQATIQKAMDARLTELHQRPDITE